MREIAALNRPFRALTSAYFAPKDKALLQNALEVLHALEEGNGIFAVPRR